MVTKHPGEEETDAALESPNGTWAEQATKDAKALNEAIHELKEVRLKEEIPRRVGNTIEQPE